MDWTGEVVGLMHTQRVKQIELAQELGFTNEYVNMLLNRKRPCKDETVQRMKDAIMAIVARRETNAEN